MKSPYQNAVKRLDVAFAKFVRQRDAPKGSGRCCSCSKYILYSQGDSGHFVNRKHMATRWNETNSHLQCIACNRFDEGNAAGYTLFMIDKYGRGHVEYLRALSRETAKFTIPEIELLIVDYRKRLKNA